LILYFWARQNQRIVSAQCICPGFRKFSGKKILHRARPALYAKRKQKYQNGNIHRKLTVPTSVIMPRPRVQYANLLAYSPRIALLAWNLPVGIFQLECGGDGTPCKSRKAAKLGRCRLPAVGWGLKGSIASTPG
jgi:hypothetical protein